MAGTLGDGNGRRGSRWSWAVWTVAAGLLLVPLVAMQFTREVQWTGSDFAVFGAMLLTACGTWELAVRTTANRAYRAAVAVAVLAAFLMTWVNLAVGIIGNERNPLNLLFFVVLAVGVAGALLARFRPRGMAWALVAMALAQALVAGVALWVDEPAFVLVALFAGAWLAAAWLFRKAAAAA